MTLETSQGLFRDQISEICERPDMPAHEAFPRWVCRHVLGIVDEAAIGEAVSIGGRDDFGVDVFYTNESGDSAGRYVCWIQAKYSDSLDHRITREEVESFVGTRSHLRRCPDGANRIFRQKSAEFARIDASQPHVKKRMIFAVTGKANDQVRALLGDQRWREERLGGPGSNTSLEILDMDGILSRMTVPHTPTLQIRFDGSTIDRKDGATGGKSIIGHVSAGSMVSLARAHKETLFLENPRQTLGDKAPTHKAILNTLSDGKTRSRFWKLNNGITAVCTRLDAVGGSAYSVENFKIVNGRQTIYTLENSTHPADDVFLLVSIHEAVDDEERNQISEATNTQNPVRPADLVTNYPEMTELVLQCRKDFPEFYFERQTQGFGAASVAVRNRVTHRRVMEKGYAARAYCAYAIDPNDAIAPDSVLFSPADGHYDKIFKDRRIRDLIVPHIFMQLFGELHRKWCRDLRDEPSDKVARAKGIISKDIVKYYALRFVYESMIGLNGPVRASVEDGLIEAFGSLKRKDPVPQRLLDVAGAAYESFMAVFNAERKNTWPEDLLRKIGAKGYRAAADDVPSPYDIMQALRQRGDKLLPHLLTMRGYMADQFGDAVQEKLRRLAVAR